MVKGFRYDRILVAGGQIENLKSGGCKYGYSFKIQYPSYRGTFVSCIEKIEFIVDGETLDNADVRFALNGKEFLIDELRELHREYWFILDYADIRVFRDGGLTPGEHEVTVRLSHRIPYTGYFGQYMVQDSKCSKKLTVA